MASWRGSAAAADFVRIIDGQRQSGLCVWREGVVRSPAEARRFFVEGCDAGPEEVTPALSSFVRTVRRELYSAFGGPRLERGRLALYTTDETALHTARELSFSLGLSSFQPRLGVEVATLTIDVLSLSRCLALLLDGQTRYLSLHSTLTGVHVRRAQGSEAPIEAVVTDVRAGEKLRPLGFAEGEDRKPIRALHGTSYACATVLARVLQACSRDDETSVVVRIPSPAPVRRVYLEQVEATPQSAQRAGE